LEGSTAKKATFGFAISLIAGILVLIDGIALYGGYHYILKTIFASLGLGETPLGQDLYTLGIMAIVFAIITFIGAYLIYMPGREMIGGIVVLIFSIISIITGGGFIIGMILGIVGGILGFMKK